RGQADAFVLAAGAEVGQLLGLERVDLEVLRLGILAYDHPFVELLAGRDEQRAALLERVQGVGDRLALLHRDQHAVLAALDRALPRAVLLEQAVHDAGAAGVGEELAVVADQAAARGREGDAGLAAARGAHVGHLALPLGDLLDDRAGELVVDVDDDGLVGFLAAVRAFAVEHARATDAELEALAAHGLDQDAELQLAATGDFERVLAGALGHADGDVALGLAFQPVADHAALHLVALAPGIGAVVDAEGHRQRRRVDRARGNRSDDRGAGERVGDGRLGQPGDGDDVARLGALDRHALEPAVGENLGRAAFLDGIAVDVDRPDRHVDLEPAAFDATGEDAAEERVAVEQRREHGELAVDRLSRRGHMADDDLEQLDEIAAAGVGIGAGVA